MTKEDRYEMFLIELSRFVPGNDQLLIRSALRGIGGYTDEQINAAQFGKVKITSYKESGENK